MIFRPQVTVLLLAGLLVCGSALASDDDGKNECSNLLTTRCEACHYKARICESVGTKSETSWERTVHNMVLYGAQLSSDAEHEVVECLSQDRADLKNFCGK